MATAKQLAANRRNARASTGPATRARAGPAGTLTVAASPSG